MVSKRFKKKAIFSPKASLFPFQDFFLRARSTIHFGTVPIIKSLGNLKGDELNQNSLLQVIIKGTLNSAGIIQTLT